jgi:hypothetical protein
MADIADNLDRNRTVLVGNTFSGRFADKLEGAHAPAKLLLFSLREHTKPFQQLDTNVALFHLECLRRLYRRAVSCYVVKFVSPPMEKPSCGRIEERELMKRTFESFHRFWI